MSVPMNHYKDLIRLGLPIMLGQLGVIVLSFVDTMMVGHCGTAELGAASFVNNMFNLVIVFSTGFSYGLTPVVGEYYGKGDVAAAGGILKTSLCVNGLTGLVLTGLMLALYMCVHLLGQPEELLGLIRPYYLTLLFSLVFILVFNAFKQFFEGVTDTMTPMFILIAGNVLNIFGNWLLIYGNFGFPQLGLVGAGISTLFARIMMLVAALLVFLFSGRYKEFRKGFHEKSINRSDFMLLNRLGLPVGLQMGMETGSFSLSTIMVGWLGTVALAAHQIMITVGQLGFMLYYGMAAAVAVKVSNYKGGGDTMSIRNTVKAGFNLILLMALFVSLFMLLFRKSLGLLFTESAEVAAMVANIIIPFVIYQFGDGMQCNYSNALRGISDVKMVTWYAFLAYFVISLPSAYLFGFIMDLGLIGIWMSFPLGLTSAGLMFRRRFLKTLEKDS